MGSTKDKINAAALPKSLRKTFEMTLTPPDLTSGGIASNPNLSRGVVHLRHWLELAVTVNITNSTGGALTVGGTASPNGALDYLQSIYYSSNTSEKFFILPGHIAFKIGMWQMGIDTSVNSALNSILANDSIKGAPTASIPATGSSNFTAIYRIPVNFSGTHINMPALMGFSTLNPVIKTFEINLSFGTVASMLSGIATGLTASITSSKVSVYSEFYPPNYNTIASSYEPPYYSALALANSATNSGATADGSLDGIPKGAGYIYKSLFAFVDDTASTPFRTPSDNILTNVGLQYNTTNYLLNQMSGNIMKAEAQLIGNNSVAVGMYPIPIIYQGSINDVLNTENFSSFNLLYGANSASSIALYGETVKANVAA